MSARAAYMSSFATTGILLAGALVVLAMAGAIVVFHAWPHGTSTAPVAPVGVGAGGWSRTIATVTSLSPPAGTPPTATRARAPRADSAGSAPVAGLVKVPTTTAAAAAPLAAAPAVPTAGELPEQAGAARGVPTHEAPAATQPSRSRHTGSTPRRPPLRAVAQFAVDSGSQLSPAAGAAIAGPVGAVPLPEAPTGPLPVDLGSLAPAGR